MKVVLFGATGMVGQGALRECILDPGVEAVLCVGRRPSGATDPKVQDLVGADLTDYRGVMDRLAGWDACFFCLGVSSAGMTEDAYRKVTVDIAVAAGRALAEKSPGMTFVFVSGAGTDGTGTSRTMWARVKGEAENAILALPFARAYAFRPAVIRPLHGIQSRTTAYRIAYAVIGHDHRAPRKGDADGGTAGRADARAREQGHRRAGRTEVICHAGRAAP